MVLPGDENLRGLGQKDPILPNARVVFIAGREAIAPPKATSQFTSGPLMDEYNKTHYYAPVYSLGREGEWRDASKYPQSPDPASYCNLSLISCVEGCRKIKRCQNHQNRSEIPQL